MAPTHHPRGRAGLAAAAALLAAALLPLAALPPLAAAARDVAVIPRDPAAGAALAASAASPDLSPAASPEPSLSPSPLPSGPAPGAEARRARRAARKAARKAKRVAKKAARAAKREARKAARASKAAAAAAAPATGTAATAPAAATAAVPAVAPRWGARPANTNYIKSCKDLAAQIAQITDAAASVYTGPGSAYTLTLDCAGKFDDCDPTQDMHLEGRARVTINAAPGCTVGTRRPVLTVADASVTDGLRFFTVYGYEYDYYTYHAISVTSIVIENLIIDCKGTRPGLSLNWVFSATLNNVDFINCVAESDYDGEGAALRAENSQVVVNSGRMANNRAYDGGALYLYSDYETATATMTSVQITGNNASNSVAGAVYLYKDASKSMTYRCIFCQIANNAASDTGAVMYSERYDTTDAGGPGGPLVIDMRFSSMAGNTAGDGTAMCGLAGKQPFRPAQLWQRTQPGFSASKAKDACSKADCNDFCITTAPSTLTAKVLGAPASPRPGFG